MRRIPSGLAPVIFIPGLMYEALVRARNGLYSSAALPQHRLPGPVISIGNITMGGTGKTPLVIHIAQMLKNLGFSPVVLSRGYGRAEPNRTHILSPGDSVPSPAETLGDEPALIRRHLPSMWMGISKDRFSAGSAISKRLERAVFILDDGFQHRSLHRDLDIVIIDRSQPLTGNRVFPRGTLREPLSALHRCDMVVINGMQAGEGPDAVAAEILRYHEKAQLFFCKQTVESMIPFSNWKEEIIRGFRPLPVESTFLVAALGNPERFERDILQLKISVRGTRFFPDHYRLKPNDWKACAEEARRRKVDAIITTEKDAIKMSQLPDFPVLVSVQSTILFDSAAFERILKNRIEERL
jgi:tetraacyldisaccharide 4'-kinase